MAQIIIFRVEKNQRLDTFLQEMLPEKIPGQVSNSKIRRLIIAKCVFVNERLVERPAFELRKGSSVKVVYDSEKFFFEKQPDDIDFTLTEKDVLYEDDVIIVVNKPAFLPVEGTIVEGRKNLHDCVVDYLWKKNASLRNPPYVGIMHRLDRETSGVILFTKSRTVNGPVHDMFENHTAKKVYRAVCTVKNPDSLKKLKNGKLSVENFIGRISPKSQQCKIGLLDEKKGGQRAKTEFTLAGEKNERIYVDCNLFTGRTHQIRVHLSLSGLPILGDQLYGGQKNPCLNGRIMLHAASLTFPHPVTQKNMTVEAPLLDEFKNL